jgi:hypothetical protein
MKFLRLPPVIAARSSSRNKLYSSPVDGGACDDKDCDGAARRKRRRRYAAFLGAGTACLLGPMLVFQATLYRQNLAVADASFPTGVAFGATDRLLVIAPHCDDETLGAGGTIAQARRQGLAVRVVFMTNGDGSATGRDAAA